MATAKRTKAMFRCGECGWEAPKWVGRCGECQAWGSVAEVGAPALRIAAGAVTTKAVPIGEVAVESATSVSSGVSELDRVLGGGLVPGAVILLAGEPGVGKSTLLLEVAAQTARSGRRTLYVSGEESASQVRLRADRTGAVEPELYLAAETDLGAVLTHIEDTQPALLVVDSIQTIGTTDSDGVPGGVTQVKEVAAALVRTAKTHNITTIIVGHVTKDGSIAGPRVLEHIVDVVLNFEGSRESRLRMVRSMKNRFGPVDEVGCFDLSSDGIVPVTDPTGLFLEARTVPVSGTCIAVTMEGRRPLVAEVQALVSAQEAEKPRRATSGFDSSRLALILAVLQRDRRIRLSSRDVFAATVGGMRLLDPAADLAVAVALASSFSEVAVPSGVVTIGELGLAGQLRRVRDINARLDEAARLGFTHAIVPADTNSSLKKPAGLEVLEAFSLPDVLDALRLRP